MLDKTVRSLLVSTQQRADQRGNFKAVTVYSFFLGANGPFTLEYPAGADTEAKVQADVLELCTKLRAMGALDYAGA
jgi:hypothetical protein